MYKRTLMMNMRILLLVLLMSLFAQAQDNYSNANVIEWTVGRKLNWNDFKGKVPAVTREAALSKCGFGYATNRVNRFEKVEFTVIARFYPDQSWVHPDKTSIRLLQHEQRHFDLCEIYARKLRKLFATEKWTGADMRKADKLYQDTYKELAEMQQKYDEETIHGLDTEKQNEWNETLAKQLNELAEFGKK